MEKSLQDFNDYKGKMVYKEESVFSFDNCFDEHGIFVNLNTLYAFGKNELHLDQRPSALYLNIRKKYSESKSEEKVTKLAINAKDGFQDNRKSIETKYYLYNGEYEQLGESVHDSIVNYIVQHGGHEMAEEEKEWEEKLKDSKYAEDLIQLENGFTLNFQDWKCQKCGQTENLWMNLSDGFIGCGRKNWDGSGGCGEALVHFQDTNQLYPLVVKLKTITPETADVFSYAEEENDMVKDPYLKKHLQHWGIDMDKMKKSEKSMNELQIDLNKNYDFDKITEAGEDLESRQGKGYLGLVNLGNSCYMNSVVQVLATIPEIVKRYHEQYKSIVDSVEENPAQDVLLQMGKLCSALVSDRYIGQVRPSMFKSVIGKNHVDFKTSQQQDAVEYMQYLLDVVSKKEKNQKNRMQEHWLMDDLFQFTYEDRIECVESKQVKYVQRPDSILQIRIPIEKATNANEVEQYKEAKRQKTDGQTIDPVAAQVPFQTCLAHTFQPEQIDDFFSSALGKKSTANRSFGFLSFPKYLFVQMGRYYVSEDWTPKKMEVSVDVPEELCLENFRSKGKQDHEVLLPESSQHDDAQPIEADQTLVAQLVSMGFSENGCKRAAIATNNANSEAAMEWIFAHMEDSNFNDPIESTTNENTMDSVMVENLCAMGFTKEQSTFALKKMDGNIERAAEWLFTHMDDLESMTVATDQKEPTDPNIGKSSKYKLTAFISHMGSNTACGHYVCHIKKDGEWVLYNDEKVAVSKTPPFGLGYLYIFQRVD